ncbi:MAG: WxL protein peptidoglycan domain-containing protein [Sporichthyaceae bacterium]
MPAHPDATRGDTQHAPSALGLVRACHARGRRRIAPAAALALALAFTCGGGVVAPAQATPSPAQVGAARAVAAAEEDKLTWSVQPRPVRGEPLRSNYEYALAPGQSISDSIRVRNYTDELLKLSIYSADAFNGADGTLDLRRPLAGELSTDVGAWITLAGSELRIPARRTVDVPFTLTVPAAVEPGDHVGGIITSFFTDSASQAPVKLDRRLGARVQVRIAGDLRPALTITNLSTSHSRGLNPISSSQVTTTYTVTNTGNVRLAAEQSIRVAGLFGFPSTRLRPPDVPELYPGNAVTLRHAVSGVWPVLRTTATVALAPKPTRPGDVFAADLRVSQSQGLWTVPWTLLVLIGAGAGVITVRRRGQSLANEPTASEGEQFALAGTGARAFSTPLPTDRRDQP